MDCDKNAISSTLVKIKVELMAFIPRIVLTSILPLYNHDQMK